MTSDLVPRSVGQEPTAHSSSAARKALLVASAATFLAFLDVTIVNVAFADLRLSFPDAGLSTLSWIVTGYALAFAALLAPLGRVADALGRVRVLVTGLLGFAVGSLAAALAPTLGLLLAARVVQGAAAAAMIPAALGVVLGATPVERRPRAVAAWAAAGSLAAALGPVAGGLLVDPFGWRAAFWVNVPLAVLVVLAARRLPSLERSGESALPDLPGVLMVIAGPALVVAGLAQAGDWGWVDAGTVALLAPGLLLCGLAARRSLRARVPAVDLRLLADSRLRLATATSTLLGASLFAWLLFGVLFLTSVWGYSVLTAGVASAPGALASVAGAVVAGRLAERRPAGLLVAIGGLLVAGTGAVVAAAAGAEPSYLGLWLPAGLVSGVGIAFVVTGASSAAAAGTPPSSFAAGTGLLVAARQLGGAVGVALCASLLGATADTLDGFRLVFAACAVAALLAAATGPLLARAEGAHR